MVTVKNLSYGYRKNKQVLHDLSFSLRPGMTLLVGENGSGKSTLIKLLVSALPAKQDVEMEVDGQTLRGVALKQKMAYLPQGFEIYPTMKVRDILRFVAKAKGAKADMAPDRIREIARGVHVEDFLDQKFKECSIGTQRRIGIATALIGDPEIIILDEPTAGVDPKERIRFYQLVKEAFAGKTVLLATHILDDMDVLADDVIMISKGRMAYCGVYRDFRHSLDGHVYEIPTDALTQSESDYVKHSVLLGNYEGDGGRVYRVANREAAPDATGRFVSVQPTLEDIWLYYQEMGGNG